MIWAKERRPRWAASLCYWTVAALRLLLSRAGPQTRFPAFGSPTYPPPRQGQECPCLLGFAGNPEMAPHGAQAHRSPNAQDPAQGRRAALLPCYWLQAENLPRTLASGVPGSGSTLKPEEPFFRSLHVLRPPPRIRPPHTHIGGLMAPTPVAIRRRAESADRARGRDAAAVTIISHEAATTWRPSGQRWVGPCYGLGSPDTRRTAGPGSDRQAVGGLIRSRGNLPLTDDVATMGIWVQGKDHPQRRRGRGRSRGGRYVRRPNAGSTSKCSGPTWRGRPGNGSAGTGSP
jgi:hypothetical protein